MEKDKEHVNQFIKCIFDDNFADAKVELESAILEKLKGQIVQEIASNEKGA